MIKAHQQFFRNFLYLILTFLLTGCAVFEPAASIRVEVDVYKGPLSKPIDIQKAELLGIIKEAVLVGKQYGLILIKVDNCYLIIGPFSTERCDAIRNISAQLKATSDESFTRLNSYSKFNSDKEKFRTELADLAEIAAQMKTQSAATVAGMIPYFSSYESLRIAQSIFAVMSSEFGNLIGSRVDSLMIQLYGYGDAKNDNGPIVRSQMHLHKYLADSSVTKAPKLYDWYDAHAPFVIEEWKYLIPGFNANMAERIKIYETIFNDVYWSNVNTVYASGIGKVNMALIRDEIGNWNLKNFDNDPTELMSAYKDLTLQSIKTAKELVKLSSGGGAQAVDAAVNIVNKITSRLNDTDPPTVPIAKLNQRVSKLNQRVSMQLKNLQQNSQAEWDALNCKSASTLDHKSNCKEILKTMNKRIKEFLHDYSIVLDTLQEMNLPVTSMKTVDTVQSLKQVTGK